MSVPEQFEVGEWIEDAAAGINRPVRPQDVGLLLRKLKEFGLVLPFAKSIPVEDQENQAAIHEAVTRAAFLRSACLQELDSALFALLAARNPVSIHSAVAAYLTGSETLLPDMELRECEIRIHEGSFVDAQRVLGRAGFRAKDRHSDLLLCSSQAAPPIQLRRAHPADLVFAMPGRLRECPEAVKSPLPTQLITELMQDFSKLDHDSLRLLWGVRALLLSDFRDEIDWLKFAKSLAQAGVMGRAIAGFFILSQQWRVKLEEPIQSLVSSRTRGLSGELLRAWFSPRELLRPSVPQVRQLLGRMIALR